MAQKGNPICERNKVIVVIYAAIKGFGDLLWRPHLTIKGFSQFLRSLLILVTFLGLCYACFRWLGVSDIFQTILEKAGVSKGGEPCLYVLVDASGGKGGSLWWAFFPFLVWPTPWLT